MMTPANTVLSMQRKRKNVLIVQKIMVYISKTTDWNGSVTLMGVIMEKFVDLVVRVFAINYFIAGCRCRLYAL